MDYLAGTVSSHMVRIVADTALAAGIDPTDIANAVGLDLALLADNEIRVPAISMSRLWELLYLRVGHEAGVLAADTSSPGRLYVWDYLFSSAPTLGGALRDAARFSSTICDARVGLQLIEDGRMFVAQYIGKPYASSINAVNTEFGMAVTSRRARERFGDAGVPVRVDVSHDAPYKYDYLVQALGTTNIHFGQDIDAITFLSSDHADEPGPGDQILQGILRSHAQNVLESVRPVPMWIDSFRTVLEESLTDGGGRGMTLAEVARTLGVSERTVQRRLAAHDTTWRAELEAVRRRIASNLLRDRTMSIQSIALRLGYYDIRALASAFRRWTGRSPAEFRRSFPI